MNIYVFIYYLSYLFILIVYLFLICLWTPYEQFYEHLYKLLTNTFTNTWHGGTRALPGVRKGVRKDFVKVFVKIRKGITTMRNELEPTISFLPQHKGEFWPLINLVYEKPNNISKNV